MNEIESGVSRRALPCEGEDEQRPRRCPVSFRALEVPPQGLGWCHQPASGTGWGQDIAPAEMLPNKAGMGWLGRTGEERDGGIEGLCKSTNFRGIFCRKWSCFISVLSYICCFKTVNLQFFSSVFLLCFIPLDQFYYPIIHIVSPFTFHIRCLGSSEEHFYSIRTRRFEIIELR